MQRLVASICRKDDVNEDVLEEIISQKESTKHEDVSIKLVTNFYI